MRPTVFVGLRGMGKTALLRRCVAMAREDSAVVVSIEAAEERPLSIALADGLSAASRQISVAARFRGAVDDFRKAMPGATFDLPGEIGKIEIDLRASGEQVPLQRALADLNDAVRRRGSYLVIAIDEVQEANLSDLRDVVMFVHATAGTTRPAVFFGAGLTNSAGHLHDARTYTERWRYPRLERLSLPDTKDAIRIPAKDNGVSITASALEALATETAGYPFFIQEYASVIWTQSVGPTIDRAEVERRLSAIRQDLDEQFYTPRFARLTTRECAYVLALARLGDGPQPVFDVAEHFGMKSSEVSSIRNQLIRKEVLFASSPGMVEFRMPLTDRYIERNRESLENRARGSGLSRRQRREPAS